MYGCITWSLTVDSVLNQEHHDFHSLTNIWVMELRSMMWHGCVAFIERKRNASRFVMGKLKERKSLEDLDINRIALSWILRE